MERAAKNEAIRRGKNPLSTVSQPDVLQRLRQLPALTLLSLWRRGLVSSLSSEQDERRSAAALLEAVQTEWSRRQGQPLSADAFRWPTTDVFDGDRGLELGEVPSVGMLSLLGYHVGQTNGVSPAMRRAILDRIFSGGLPPVLPSAQLAEWDLPLASGRLKKMADCLASFCRLAKRQDGRQMHDAIADWEADLAYLYDRYYVGRFHFGWPVVRN